MTKYSPELCMYHSCWIHFFQTAFHDFRRWWILPGAYIIQILWKLIWYHALTFETTSVLQMLVVTLTSLMLAYKSVQQDVLLFALKNSLKFCGLLHFWFGVFFLETLLLHEKIYWKHGIGKVCNSWKISTFSMIATSMRYTVLQEVPSQIPSHGT